MLSRISISTDISTLKISKLGKILAQIHLRTKHKMIDYLNIAFCKRKIKGRQLQCSKIKPIIKSPKILHFEFSCPTIINKTMSVSKVHEPHELEIHHKPYPETLIIRILESLASEIISPRQCVVKLEPHQFPDITFLLKPPNSISLFRRTHIISSHKKTK